MLRIFLKIKETDGVKLLFVILKFIRSEIREVASYLEYFSWGIFITY